MRLTLNALIGVILLIFSFIIALIIGSKFFSEKNNICLDSFFSLYHSIEELQPNSYTSITLISKENCLIAYYPKTALLFNKDFFETLRNLKKKKKETFDYFRFFLKYPISYSCKNLVKLEGCSDFNNFYTISSSLKENSVIFDNYINSIKYLIFPFSFVIGKITYKIIEKEITNLIKEVILKEVMKKLERSFIKTLISKLRNLAVRLSLSIIGVASSFFSPFSLLYTAIDVGLTLYSVWDIFTFLEESYSAIKTISDSLNDFLFFWNNKFLEYVWKNHDIINFYLSDKSKENLKGKEGSLIFCELKEKICHFKGKYFKKLKDVDYVSGGIALIYPVFFENALFFNEYSKNEEKSLKKENFYIFKLKLINGKNLVVLMNKEDPYIKEALYFFDLLKNKDLYGLSNLKYVSVGITKNKNKLETVIYFYGLINNSKTLNPTHPLLIKEDVDLKYFLGKEIYSYLLDSLHKDKNNATVVFIEDGCLQLFNKISLNNFFNEIVDDMEKKYEIFNKTAAEENVYDNLIPYFTNFNRQFMKNKKNKEIVTNFVYSFFREKFYEYYILTYSLNRTIKEENVKNFLYFLESMVIFEPIRDNFLVFSQKIDSYVLLYVLNETSVISPYFFIDEINTLNNMKEFKNEVFLYNLKKTAGCSKKCIETLNILESRIRNIYFSYDIKLKEHLFFKSLYKIVDYVLTNLNTENIKK